MVCEWEPRNLTINLTLTRVVIPCTRLFLPRSGLPTHLLLSTLDREPQYSWPNSLSRAACKDIKSRGSAGVQTEMYAKVAGGWFSVRDDDRSSAGGAGTALIPHITWTSINITKLICIHADGSLNNLWVSTLLLNLQWLYLRDYR